MKNLTKENFWNLIEKDFPEAFKMFSDWIDKYKEEIGWKQLFGDNLKFHDMPFEFQNGVLARFDIECYNGIRSGKGKAVYENNRSHYVNGFAKLFQDLQTQLNKEKN